MRNLELKAHCADLGAGEATARGLGATAGGTLHQVDTYFVTAAGRLKLRQINRGGGELIYYERAEDRAVRWSNYHAAPVEDCAALRDVLGRAYAVRLEVEKARVLFLYQGARIHLDQVAGLGTFLEFEVPVATESDAEREHASQIMDELMAAFRIRPSDSVQASYADLLEGGG